MVGSTAVVRSTPSQKKLPDTALAAAYAAASRLMDGMLHDARNPLNALAINLEVLSEKLRGEDGEVPPSQERNLKAMREQIFRVDAILKRFAEFIAPAQGLVGEVDVAEALTKALEVVGHDSRKRRVKLRPMLDPGICVRCEDTSAMHLLLVQMLLRALARSEAGTEVEVRIERQGDRPVVRVVDAAGPRTEPYPEMASALGLLAQHNGFTLELEDGRCVLALTPA